MNVIMILLTVVINAKKVKLIDWLLEQIHESYKAGKCYPEHVNKCKTMCNKCKKSKKLTDC